MSTNMLLMDTFLLSQKQVERLNAQLAQIEEDLSRVAYRFDEQSPKEWLDLQDFAGLMGVALRTAFKWKANGVVPFELCGRKWRCRRSDVVKIFSPELSGSDGDEPRVVIKIIS